MAIERTDKEIAIRISANTEVTEIQDLIDFIRYKELTSNFKVKKSAVDKLAASVNTRWWKKNAKKILNARIR